MTEMKNPVQVGEKIFWVGKVDDRDVPFHRLTLEKGTTYNSYLLATKKPTIIDTVDILFGREYVENLSRVIDLSTIAYIVINHVEPDHAGALPALLAKASNAEIVTTALGAELLQKMFKIKNRSFIIINDGDTLDIGGKTLQFFETPYLHTAETMITYSVEDKILFPCDQFSTHIATTELFNDLAPEDYMPDFKLYYELIIGPHRPHVRDMLKKIEKLDIDMIAPSHGYILREDAGKFIELYDQMSTLPKEGNPKKVTIVYSTMTGNTGKIAERLAEGLKIQGVEAEIFDLRKADLAEAAAHIKDSDGLLVGSSTRYADMVGQLEELLGQLPEKSFAGIPAAAFGSFGWSGEATLHIEAYLRKAGFEVIDERYLIGKLGMDYPIFPLRIKFVDEGQLDTAKYAGEVFAEQVLIA